MTASDLSEWIALFQMELSADGQGGFLETIPSVLSPDRPANVRRVSGATVSAMDQTASRIRYDITIRYEPGITIAWRVLWNDQYFDITDVSNTDNGNAWLTLRCERKEAGTQ